MLKKDCLTSAFNAFFSVSYIPFVLPALLAFMHMDQGITWLYTCILITCVTAMATFITKRPIIAGPGIAGIVIISNLSKTVSDPQNIVSIIIITACILAITSLTQLPASFISVLSNRVKTGFKAGVGLMFITIAFSMLEEQHIHYFLVLVSILYFLRSYSVACPIICIVITIFLNKSTAIHPDFILPELHTPKFDLSIWSATITLALTMFIDCTITGNTLNPGNENKSIQVASIGSLAGSITNIMPCSIYIESLIFSKETTTQASYILAGLFLLLGVFHNLVIPGFIAAALLALLGLKVILGTQPKIWFFKSPQIIIMMLVIAITRSFLYGIFIGITLDVIQALYQGQKLKANTINWLLFLATTSVILNLN